MSKKINKIPLLLLFVVVIHYLLELIYRVVTQSILYDTSVSNLVMMANNMISYHIVFNILYIPIFLILALNIKQYKLLFLLNFLTVTFFCAFILKTDYLNSVWFLKTNFSLSVSSFILFILSLLCPKNTFISFFSKN